MLARQLFNLGGVFIPRRQQRVILIRSAWTFQCEILPWAFLRVDLPRDFLCLQMRPHLYTESAGTVGGGLVAPGVDCLARTGCEALAALHL